MEKTHGKTGHTAYWHARPTSAPNVVTEIVCRVRAVTRRRNGSRRNKGARQTSKQGRTAKTTLTADCATDLPSGSVDVWDVVRCFTLSWSSARHTAEIVPCGSAYAHGKDSMPWSSLPCAFCRALTHGKVFAVWIKVFAVGPRHMAES
jgi:hypothetical protein